MGQAAVLPAPFYMPTMRCFFLAIFALTLPVLTHAGQTSQKQPVDDSALAERGIGLARQGRCAEALPLLGKATPHLAANDLKRKAGLAAVRCALSRRDTPTAVETLLMLNRAFPRDPEVLYVTTHAYSDLATRASQELATVAPTSPQALELNAEALESQGKWKEAKEQYEQILAQHPDLPGIHFRLGGIILSEPATPTTAEDAKKEFEAELKDDPSNAGAEYVLGELARQAQQWDVAIEHFERATKLDVNFADAYRGLGMSLNASGKFADAVAPLERYVKLQPGDPAGHYQLAIACARSGRKEEAEHEMELQREADEAVRKAQGQAGEPNQPPPAQP